MNQILIISQDKKFTGLCKYIGIGKRTAKTIIGDKLNKILNERNISQENFIKMIGNSYRNNVMSILNNDEQPSSKLIEIITTKLNISNDYFEDKELENVLVTDNGMIIGEFSTNERALEVKKMLDTIMVEGLRKNFNIILEIPEK